jgi:hypothetical protein
MLKEIYCRNENDPKYVNTILETTDAIEALLTKLRMILFTARGEVLGYPNLGLDLDSMLFELNYSLVLIFAISTKIKSIGFNRGLKSR